MLEHLEWKSLEQRRKVARLTMMYKITKEKVAIPMEGHDLGAHTNPTPSPQKCKNLIQLCQ
jgi:hypothetical protein